MSAGEAVYAGIDQGESELQVCVLASGSAQQRTFEYSGAGLEKLVAWLTSQAGGEHSRQRVALEVPRGPIVECLIEAGIAVFSVNPKQVDRFRDRFTVAGSKDDRLDARVLADSLRTDPAAFRRLRVDAEALTQLREASRLEDEIKLELRRYSNRLRSLLQRYHVELLALVPAADEPWFWSLVELAPTPAIGKRLSPKRVERLLREHRIRRFTPEDVIARLRALPLPAAKGLPEACSEHALLLVAQLRLLDEQVERSQARVERLLNALADESGDEGQGEHRDVDILRSLPGLGRYAAATMLAEASEALRLRDYRALRAQAGSAPVTKQSGRLRVVSMRRACNARLRHAIRQWAFNAVRLDPRAAAQYKALCDRGHSHSRALRGVADRLLKLLVVMLESGRVYDPSLRLVA
jgi:transposase